MSEQTELSRIRRQRGAPQQGGRGLQDVIDWVWPGTKERWGEQLSKGNTSYPPLNSYNSDKNRTLSNMGSRPLEMGLDWMNPVPIQGIDAFLAGITKRFNRGYEEGTWDMAFKYPRELGSHGSVGTKISDGFYSIQEVNLGNKGAKKSFNIDLNPLETVDTNMAWNPFTTLRSLKQKGLDKLSKKAQYKLNKIANQYIEEDAVIRRKYNDPLELSDAKDTVAVKYNREVQKVIKAEGYDSISYPAAEGEVFGEKGSWESLILFDDPMKAPISNKSTDMSLYDEMMEPHKSEYFREWKKKGYQVLYMSPDEYIDRYAKGIMKRSPEQYPDLKSARSAITSHRHKLARKYAKEMGEMEGKGPENQFPMGVLDYGHDYMKFDQEGAHRAMAAKKAGYSKIPVLIRGTTSRKSRRPRSRAAHKDYLAKKQRAPVSSFAEAKEKKELQGFYNKMRDDMKKMGEEYKTTLISKIENNEFKYKLGSIYKGSNGINYKITGYKLHPKRDPVTKKRYYQVAYTNEAMGSNEYIKRGEKGTMIQDLMKNSSIYTGPQR